MSIITKEQPKKRSKSVKCPHCEHQLDRDIEPFVEHSKRYYHQGCFNTRFAEIQARNELYEYICKLQDIPYPNGYILRQIKEFQENNNYSIRGMLTTLKYAHEIEGVPVKKDVGIGIIEYYYKKALAYHTNLHRIRQKNINYDNKEETIYTSAPKQRVKKMIDIGGL